MSRPPPAWLKAAWFVHCFGPPFTRAASRFGLVPGAQHRLLELGERVRNVAWKMGRFADRLDLVDLPLHVAHPIFAPDVYDGPKTLHVMVDLRDGPFPDDREEQHDHPGTAVVALFAIDDDVLTLY